MPATIGQLFPSTDPLSRWMVSLSALTDDLSVLDHHLHQSFHEDPVSPAVTYFRLIVARIYEGERIVTEMDAQAAVVDFLATVPQTVAAGALLRAAYRRDLTIKKKSKQSRVEQTFAQARHLTVHYPQGGELARILRDARHLDARAWVDDERESLRYLWPQDVMEHALWPTGSEHRPDVEFAHELTQAFAQVLKHALPAYIDRVGVDPNVTFVQSDG